MFAADHADISDGIVLLGCELITNAIRHSDSARLGEDGRPGRVTIVVLETGDLPRVEVIAAGSAHRAPRMVDHAPESTSGRGLRIVDELTGRRWGTHVDDSGQTVWFAVPLSRG